jgi:hypothetical protein
MHDMIHDHLIDVKGPPLETLVCTGIGFKVND